MVFLVVVSILWALSFGLIKTYLSATDAYLVSLVRMLLSFVIFLPLLKPNRISLNIQFKLISTGAVQYGLMYIFYIHSFAFLKAYQVALFTIYTPVYVSLINDVLEKKIHVRFLLTAVISVIGTAVILHRGLDDSNYLFGFFLVQISNLSFAFGQIYYKKLITANRDISQAGVFGFLYAGALLITALSSTLFTDWTAMHLDIMGVFTLFYLGVVASGVCFFLWNFGATRTNPGTLAAMNNLKIPLAVFASMILFGESGSLWRLILGSGIILVAIVLSERLKHGT